jgi:hypothetical protein
VVVEAGDEAALRIVIATPAMIDLPLILVVEVVVVVAISIIVVAAVVAEVGEEIMATARTILLLLLSVRYKPKVDKARVAVAEEDAERIINNMTDVEEGVMVVEAVGAVVITTPVEEEGMVVEAAAAESTPRVAVVAVAEEVTIVARWSLANRRSCEHPVELSSTI